MRHVFVIGPVAGEPEPIMLGGAVTLDGDLIVHFDSTPRACVDRFLALEKDLVLEPSLATEAKELGLPQAPLHELASTIKAALAVAAVNHLIADGLDLLGPVLGILEASTAFMEAKPYERVGESDMISWTLDDAGKKREFIASVVGAVGDERGVVLMPGAQDVMELIARQLEPKNLLSVGFEAEPKFAVRAVKEAFGLDRVPFFFHMVDDRPAAVGARELALLTQGLDAASNIATEGAPRPEGAPRAGRNDPCPCGSGKKYKKCCLAKDEAQKA